MIHCVAGGNEDVSNACVYVMYVCVYIYIYIYIYIYTHIQSDTKKRELLKNPTKMEEIQEKKIIDRN